MRSRSTQVVVPLEELDAPVEETDDSELAWCFDDAELTRQLRAVKRGRGAIVTIVLASVATIGAGIAFVL